MLKKLLNIEPPSLSCQSSFVSFFIKGAKLTNLAPSEAPWFVFSSRSTRVYIGRLSNKEDTWSVSDILCVSFPGAVTHTFPLQGCCSAEGVVGVGGCEKDVVGVGVCEEGGAVHRISLDQCVGILTSRQHLPRSSRKRAKATPNDRSSKKAPTPSSVEIEVINLIQDDDEEDEVVEEVKKVKEEAEDDVPMDTTPHAPSQPPSQVSGGGSDIFISLLGEQGVGGTGAGQTSSQQHCKVQSNATDKTRQTTRQHCVDYSEVSVVWFRHSDCAVTLSAVQVDDLLLFQLQNQNGSGTLALAVYSLGPECQTTPLLVSLHPIEQPSFQLEPRPLTTPPALPMLLLCHEEGTAVEKCSKVAVVTKALYKQLFPPSMALIKVPILLLGFRNGDVMYLPCPALRLPPVKWAGPICSLSQCIRGLGGVAYQSASTPCRGLAVVGGLGRVCALLESEGTSPHVEQLHLGGPVQVVVPCPGTLLVALQGELRVVSTERGSSSADSRGGRLHRLADMFRGRSLSVVGVVSAVAMTPDSNTVLVLNSKGALLVSTDFSSTTPPLPRATEGLSKKMAVLQELEKRTDDVKAQLGPCRDRVVEVNTALHALKQWTDSEPRPLTVEPRPLMMEPHTLVSEPRPLLAVMGVRVLGQGAWCCPRLQVQLQYRGGEGAGQGWTVTVSVTPLTHHLQAAPLEWAGPAHPAPPPSQRGQFTCSPLFGLSSGAVFRVCVGMATWMTRLPLLLTCSAHFTPGAAGRKGGVTRTLFTRVLTLYDFLETVPLDYVAIQPKPSPDPYSNHPVRCNLNPDSPREHRVSVCYPSSRITGFVAAVLGPGKPLGQPLPTTGGLLQALLGGSTPGNYCWTGGGGDTPPIPAHPSWEALTARCLLPEGCCVTVSVKGEGRREEEEEKTVRVSFASLSYSAVVACADHLADRMRAACKVPESEEVSVRSQRLKLEQSSLLKSIGDLQSSCPPSQRSTQQLQCLLEQVKSLNSTIIDCKTQSK